MLLTKDNLLRFVREKKYVTPTQVSENFESTTIIASAALSELAKDKSIAITNLKLSSSPYYYDKNQKEALQDLGIKHFKGTELEIFKRLQESQLINDASLSIPEQLAISKISDFAIPLEIQNPNQNLKFWVWYLRDIIETKKQIQEYLNGTSEKKETPKKEIKNNEIKQEVQQIQIHEEVKINNSQKQTIPEFKSNSEIKVEKDSISEFIENYLRSNYLKIEEIDKMEDGYLYTAILKINKIKIHFNCRYFSKKPQEGDIIKFYTSSMNPKIVFIENTPKKLFKLTENLENLELVNI